VFRVTVFRCPTQSPLLAGLPGSLARSGLHLSLMLRTSDTPYEPQAKVNTQFTLSSVQSREFRIPSHHAEYYDETMSLILAINGRSCSGVAAEKRLKPRRQGSSKSLR